LEEENEWRLQMNLGDFASVVATIGSIVAIILALRKQPHEEKNMDASTDSTKADVTAKYQEIAMKSATRITQLEKELEEVKTELSNVIDELKSIRQELLDHKDWNNRLVYQIKSLPGKIQPVPFKNIETKD
jgi:septal ring factor EnvC (AmiA/AmiB activator)